MYACRMILAEAGRMSRLLSCSTLVEGVPLLTTRAGKMADCMDLDAMIAVPCLPLYFLR